MSMLGDDCTYFVRNPDSCMFPPPPGNFYNHNVVVWLPQFMLFPHHWRISTSLHYENKVVVLTTWWLLKLHHVGHVGHIQCGGNSTILHPTYTEHSNSIVVCVGQYWNASL